MKTGFFSAHSDPHGSGGAERYLLSMMLGVREHGHEPVLFGVENALTVKQAQEHDIPVVIWRKASDNHETHERHQKAIDQAQSTKHKARRIKHFLRRLIPPWVRLFLGAMQETMALAKLFRRHPLDVMHVNNNVYEMAGVACWLIGIPSVCVHHFMPPDEAYWARRFLIRQTNRFYSRVVGVSNACITAWREYAPIKLKKSCFVYNGIDLEKFHPPGQGDNHETHERHETREQVFQLISVGRLDPMKGFLDLIDALALLDDPNIHLWIVGEGAQRPELDERIGEHGLEESCQLLGNREEIPELLRQADCFVLVSVCKESFGLALVEAMATGLPVITSDFGPLPEINFDDKTGIVVRTGSHCELAKAIGRLRDSRELRIRMGVAARAQSLDTFGEERMIAGMLTVYCGVTEQIDSSKS